MQNIANKKIQDNLHTSFVTIKGNVLYKKIKDMKRSTRIVIFFFCVIWFILATLLIPPIPFGNAVLILGLVILFPLDKVKSKVRYYIYKLRINRLYAKRLGVKHKRRQKKVSKNKLAD